MTVKKRLAEAIKNAVILAQKDGIFVDVELPEIVIERPQNTKHGD